VAGARVERCQVGLRGCGTYLSTPRSWYPPPKLPSTAACTKLIYETPLGASQAAAYIARGLAYETEKDYDRAIADFGKAITLDPKNALAYFGSGSAHYGKGDYDRAVADYSEAIRLGNKSALMYDTRGRAYLYAGALTKALADFDKASELNPEDPYAALWLEICNRRSDIPSVLLEATRQIDMNNWRRSSASILAS
jgi:tetratricopeptide (TPR) repeat protein